MRLATPAGVVALVGAATLVGARPASTLEASNLELVSAAAGQAVRQAVAGLELTAGNPDAPVSVVPAASHGANWLFAHLLVEELLGRGLPVTLDSTGTGGSRLTYRVVEVGMSGRSGLLSNTVTRRCRVSLQLEWSRQGERLGSSQGCAEISDRIPKGQLDALQHSRYAFANTELEKSTWGRYVEPVIVSTVLGSLVYLFFSNR